jgi:hypothetical protein
MRISSFGRKILNISTFGIFNQLQIQAFCTRELDAYRKQWSEFLATDPEARVRFSALPEKKVVCLERGPLSFVSRTEELHDRNVAAPV